MLVPGQKEGVHQNLGNNSDIVPRIEDNQNELKKGESW
jgi:hypothetical protein